jgi:translation initiation factor IF-2
MSENKAIRLSKIAREFNVGISTIVDFLQKKGHKVDPNPNTKIEADLYSLLLKEYSSDLDVKKKSEVSVCRIFVRRKKSLVRKKLRKFLN